MNVPTLSGAWRRKEGKITHAFTVRGLIVYTALTVVGAAGVTYAAMRPGTEHVSAVPTPSATTYVVPQGTPSPSLPPSEDTPGWDCRTQGNHVCKIDGELWLNVNHLPASLYARCLLGLGATGLSPEVASIDTEEICKPLYVTQG